MAKTVNAAYNRKTATKPAAVAETVTTIHSITSLAALTPPKPVILLSDEQLTIAAAVQTAIKNIMVRARAGTGKTFLLRQCLPLMSGEVAIAAYNRKIAREIAHKLAEDGVRMRTPVQADKGMPGVDVGTFHSFGWRVLRRHNRSVRLEGRHGKDAAGFIKFDLIAERLNISKPLQSLVRKAMERGQERLLELPNVADAVALAQEAAKATAQQFLDDLIPVTEAQWRGQMTDIANWYRTRGYLTERQVMSVRQSARKAGRKMQDLIVGIENAPKKVNAPVTLANGLDPAWLDLARHYALELDLPSDDSIEIQLLHQTIGRDTPIDAVREAMLLKCLKLAAEAIHISAKMWSEEFDNQGAKFTGVVSFGEMLYLPLYYNLDIPKFDWVLVDEFQDSNEARREFTRRMMKATARFFGVGDDRQAIYGFAGANSDSMEQGIAMFDCTVLPMTRTFRCGKAIVELAKTLVPDYKAGDSNPEGAVTTVTEDQFHTLEMQPTDAVICRNTAPLVQVAYKLLARNVRCHVEGRDIGKTLLPLLYRWPHLKSLPIYTDKLRDYRDAEMAKLLGEKKEEAADALNDRVETILAIIAAMNKGARLPDVQERVETLFRDTKEGERSDDVTLLTAHRSKGLEFPRVFGWGVNKYMPSPNAKQEWQQLQETNLEYVLYTRAINDLILVTVG